MYKGKRRTEMPPHIFSIADNAYNNMIQGDGGSVCGGRLGGKMRGAGMVVMGSRGKYYSRVSHCLFYADRENQSILITYVYRLTSHVARLLSVDVFVFLF